MRGSRSQAVPQRQPTLLGSIRSMVGAVQSRLTVTRRQVLAFRRRVGALDERLPKGSESLQRAAWAGLQAEKMAKRLHAHLRGRRTTDREVGRALSIGNEVRYAATTGTVAIRWGGARAPEIWTFAAPKIDPADARRELARRYLRIFGPATADGFARWAGISRSSAAGAFASLEGSLLPVRSPLGDEWLLAEDEPAIRAAAKA